MFRVLTHITTLCLAFGLVCDATAQTTTIVDFEQTGLTFSAGSGNAVRGPFPTAIDDGDNDEFTSSSLLTTGGLTLNNELEEFPGFDLFTGFYASQRTGDQFDPANRFGNNNDTVTASGSGADGSQTWVVAFADSITSQAVGSGGVEIFGNDTSILSVDGNSRIDSLFINNTALVRDSIVQGDGFAHPFGDRDGGPGGGPDGIPDRDDFFVVRFTDLDEGDFNEFTLAEFDLANNSLFVLEDFINVDLRSLDASRIGIGFRGSVVNDFGLATPTYVAIDNVQITAVPEPSLTFAAFLIGAVSMGGRRRRSV